MSLGSLKPMVYWARIVFLWSSLRSHQQNHLFHQLQKLLHILSERVNDFIHCAVPHWIISCTVSCACDKTVVSYLQSTVTLMFHKMEHIRGHDDVWLPCARNPAFRSHYHLTKAAYSTKNSTHLTSTSISCIRTAMSALKDHGSLYQTVITAACACTKATDLN